MRIVLGAYLLFILALPYYVFPGQVVSFLGNTYFSDYRSILSSVLATLAFLAFYIVVHRFSARYAKNLDGWGGTVLANVPPLLVFVGSAAAGVSYLEISVFTYVGLAMLLAGLRKDEGCEVMAPANAILGRPTNFACLIFSPIDWAEKRSHDAKGPEKRSVNQPEGSQ